MSVKVVDWSVPLKCTRRTVSVSVPYSEVGGVNADVNLADRPVDTLTSSILPVKKLPPVVP